MNFVKKLFYDNRGVYVFLVVCNLIVMNQVYGFSWQQCERGVIAKSTVFGEMWFYSSSQFTTSTGECAAIGYHSKENKELFYAQNDLELQLDIAKGEGAYVSELTAIYGCDNIEQVKRDLNQNYSQIYNSKKPVAMINSVMVKNKCMYIN